jgi:hypothetical protein
MADERKPPPQAKEAGTLPQPKPPVVEREPLTITVVEPATAEQAVQQQVQVEAPPRTEAWRPSNLGLLFLVGGVLLFTLYQLQFAPLILRWEHGLQRRIFGEREYDAHQEPHSRGVAIRPE